MYACTTSKRGLGLAFGRVEVDNNAPPFLRLYHYWTHVPVVQVSSSCCAGQQLLLCKSAAFLTVLSTHHLPCFSMSKSNLCWIVFLAQFLNAWPFCTFLYLHVTFFVWLKIWKYLGSVRVITTQSQTKTVTQDSKSKPYRDNTALESRRQVFPLWDRPQGTTWPSHCPSVKERFPNQRNFVRSPNRNWSCIYTGNILSNHTLKLNLPFVQHWTTPCQNFVENGVSWKWCGMNQLKFFGFVALFLFVYWIWNRMCTWKLDFSSVSGPGNKVRLTLVFLIFYCLQLFGFFIFSKEKPKVL